MDMITDERDAYIMMREWIRSDHEKPDEDVYYALVDRVGDIIELMNFVNGWGYKLSDEMMDRIYSLWRGDKATNRTMLRPPYTDKVVELKRESNPSYTEETYMMEFLQKNVLPLYLNKERRGRSYVGPVDAVFGNDLFNMNKKLANAWNEYIKELPRDWTVNWGNIFETDVNLPWIMAKYGFFDTIVELEGMNTGLDTDTRSITVEEDLMDIITRELGTNDLEFRVDSIVMSDPAKEVGDALILGDILSSN